MTARTLAWSALLPLLTAFSLDTGAAWAGGPACKGGTPSPKTGTCVCPAGKVALEEGDGASSCVSLAAFKGAAAASASTKGGGKGTLAIVKPGVKCPPGMALIPGGTYTQSGAEIGGAKTIGTFCMDVNEVTVAAYSTCAVSGSCTPAWNSCVYPLWTDTQLKDCGKTCNAGKTDRLNHPINCIDWGQAASYCAALGKRLAEHDEWEWAARGEAKGTTYPWGNAEPTNNVCWSGPAAEGLAPVARLTTCPVGGFPSGDNPQGVHDLAGNLQEWTASKWPGTDPLRLTKGGTWAANTGKPLRADSLNADPPLNRHNALGFRCVKDP